MSADTVQKDPGLSSRPLADRHAPFLIEDSEPYSAGRVLALASTIHDAVRHEVDRMVGVCSGSAAFVAAATLGLWKSGRRPVMLDPNLRREPEALFTRVPTMPVLVDHHNSTLPNTMLIEEEGADLLEAVWPEPSARAAVFFTSGSSGEPKLVEKRTWQLVEQMHSTLAWLGLAPGHTLSLFSLVPPFHILGFVYGLFLPLMAGGRSAFCAGASQQAWVEQIHRARPDMVVGVPLHYRLLANSLGKKLPDSIYFCSGGPLLPTVDSSFLARTGQRVVQAYGSTETGGVAHRVGFGAWEPYTGVQWKVDPDSGRLMVRSSWQAAAEQWVLTDDVVEPAERGFALLGRADSIVKVAGKRFSINEVVTAAQTLPEVSHAVAVTYDRFGEKAVALFVQPTTVGQPTVSGIRGALAERIAPFKVPRTIRLVDDVPYLSNGKVDSRRLRRWAQRADPESRDSET